MYNIIMHDVGEPSAEQAFYSVQCTDSVNHMAIIRYYAIQYNRDYDQITSDF